MPLCTPHTVELDLQDLAVKPHLGSGRGGPCMTRNRSPNAGTWWGKVREREVRVGNNTLLTTEYEYVENGMEAI